MSKIQDLANELEREYREAMAGVDAQAKKLTSDRKGLNTRSANLNAREAQIAVREAELAQMEREIKAKYDKVRTDEALKAEREALVTLRGQLTDKEKQLKDLEADCNLKLEVIKKKQLALSEDKKTYKAKIEAELQEQLKSIVK